MYDEVGQLGIECFERSRTHLTFKFMYDEVGQLGMNVLIIIIILFL